MDLRDVLSRAGTDAEAYARVRLATVELCAPLEIEDYVVQSMVDASPIRWHIAHTTWFFEQFVLGPHAGGYRVFRPEYGFLFNSYYNTVGARTPRPERGMMTRPPVREILAYRDWVDHAMSGFLEDGVPEAARDAFVLGLNHEQQHQELMLTDLKHLLSKNPLHPVYRQAKPTGAGHPRPIRWREFPGGIVRVGAEGPGFVFDNEGPAHDFLLQPFALADRLVTNGEFLEFMEDGGYENPLLWLDEGWARVRADGWRAPLYWEGEPGAWRAFTLSGLREVDPAEPVCHVSGFEADAFARWAGARLPSEEEWEAACRALPVEGNFADRGGLHPEAVREAEPPDELHQAFGDVWEWTASPYTAYPGFRAAAGALGEYNGKFMVNQMVLRGGSCVTPPGHVRATYRNFFHPEARWQFTGIRLAQDGGHG